MILTTDRLLLREIEEGDWRSVFAYQSDPRYRRYSPCMQDLQADVQGLVGTFIHWQQEQPRYRFQLAITLRMDSCLIGTCGIRATKVNRQEAELGYELHPDYWGQGYATEAARAMLTFAFGDLQLQHVWAQCIADNEASIRVVERLGMRQEQQLRKPTWIQDRWWDSLVYSIDKDVWQSSMKNV
jgi:RimJ/RimL family protein N-acetyltransferase